MKLLHPVVLNKEDEGCYYFDGSIEMSNVVYYIEGECTNMIVSEQRCERGFMIDSEIETTIYIDKIYSGNDCEVRHYDLDLEEQLINKLN